MTWNNCCWPYVREHALEVSQIYFVGHSQV